MTDPNDPLPVGQLRTLQIIAVALLLGVLVFLGVVLFLVHVQNAGQGMMKPPPDFPLVSVLAVVLLVSNVPLSFILPAVTTRAALQRMAAGTWQPPAQAAARLALDTDALRLLFVLQTSLIIGLALLEGVALLGIMAYLLEAEPFVLGVVAVVIVVMLARFPTENRVRAWLDQQTQRLADIRQ
jgi:hypothetical protein